MFLYKYICVIMFLSLGKVKSKENHHLLKAKSWTVLSEIAMGFFEKNYNKIKQKQKRKK